ncbi:MAG: AAA family ATPase [Desulfobacterales bacterium]|nr:AAA family ATPase [Desulfobacterales bacterium]
MYKNFFGFKERPFQLVPNPAYLFLSKSHEEALAHLTYAVIQGDGFVEITGEVGTGKTTLCRVFLDNPGENTESAYIFNPRLDSIQLLKAINDEFGISSKADTTKALIDTLNSFLIQKKAEGKKVILLIDEAQNLSKEVLEQLRLLSNLETSTSKLLQIIIVGQPELKQMLDSYELRQLEQRITLSCHLSPLSYKETKEYIQHRISIASRKPGIRFTRSAYRAIYKYSGGIPRLINIVCDRALLTAFGMEQFKITGGIARTAIRELAGRGDRRRYILKDGKKGILIFSALCVILVMLILYPPGNSGTFPGWSLVTKEHSAHTSENKPGILKSSQTGNFESENSVTDTATENPAKESAAHAGNVHNKTRNSSVDMPESEQSLEDFLRSTNISSSKFSALETVLRLWNTKTVIKQYPSSVNDEHVFFWLAAKQNGFLVQRVENDWTLLEKLNLPAILELRTPADLIPAYVTLVKTGNGKITLRGGDNIKIETIPDELSLYWSGEAYVPWKNFFSLSGTIPRDAPEDSVVSLKMLLQEIGFDRIDISPLYDEQTQEAVEDIQKKNNIEVDGVVGPLTKIILYNKLDSLKIPHLK